jgi:UPF0716 family protein affecting phage T7 exclusion
MIFLVIPLFFLELYLSLEVGESIGFLWASFWIIVTAVLGIFLLKLTPYIVLDSLKSFQKPLFTLQHLQKMGTFYFLSSILFIVPGVLSDFIALCLLLVVVYLKLHVKIHGYKKNQGDDNVIDVEIIE